MWAPGPAAPAHPLSLVAGQRGSQRAFLTVSADSFLVVSRMFHQCYASLAAPSEVQHAKPCPALIRGPGQADTVEP